MQVELDERFVMAWLESLRPRRVLVQGPLGLRPLAERLVSAARAAGYDALLSSSPTWGGCDMAVEEAKRVGADALIHVGHAPFLSNTEIPVLYVEARYKDYQPLKALLYKITDALACYRRVGVGASVQWLDHLPRLTGELASMGFIVYVGESGGHLAYRGQVLGCDYSSMKRIEQQVDCFLVIGSVFHALGLALISTRPTLMVDPHTQKVEWMSERANKILTTRFQMIQRFKEATRIGIIVSRKPGQFMMGLAKRLMATLKKHGKSVEIITTDEVVPEYLSDFSFDAYINTACPRLSIEDQARIDKPLLLPVEALIAVGELSWQEVLEKGLLLNVSLKL